MKAQISIKFLKIAGKRVTKDIISNSLIKSTEKTLSKLCKELKKYFDGFKIKTQINYKLEGVDFEMGEKI